MAYSFVCPLCGSKGTLNKIENSPYFERYAVYQVKCSRCDFATGFYGKAWEACHMWEEECQKVQKIKQQNIKKLSWTTTFPDIEGYYAIAPPQAGIMLNYVGCINDVYRTVTKKISDYPKGTRFYGPLPKL